MTAKTAIQVLEALKKGDIPKVGPQNGKQRVAEGPMGKTTLLDKIPSPEEFTTNLDKKEEGDENWGQKTNLWCSKKRTSVGREREKRGQFTFTTALFFSLEQKTIWPQK